MWGWRGGRECIPDQSLLNPCRAGSASRWRRSWLGTSSVSLYQPWSTSISRRCARRPSLRVCCSSGAPSYASRYEAVPPTVASIPAPFHPALFLIPPFPHSLTFAHGQIIHRDIKPGNLLVTGDRNLKVADFGVSYMYDGEDDTVRSSAGTSAFLAPEVCSGQGASGKVSEPPSSNRCCTCFADGNSVGRCVCARMRACVMAMVVEIAWEVCVCVCVCPVRTMERAAQP